MSSMLLSSSAGSAIEAAPAVRRRRSLARRVIRRSRRFLRRVVWAGRLTVSAIVLVGVLAFLAAIPILNVYVLGYLLAAEGRVGRGERWRNVLPWVRYAPRIAAIAFGTAIVVLPLMILADFARDAALVDAAGPTARVLRLATVLAGVVVTLHLFLAYARGGSLLSFFRPIKNARAAVRGLLDGNFGQTVADRLLTACAALQVLPLFWLGARGLAVAFAWLFVPCAIIAAAGPADGAGLLLKFGGGLLLTAIFPALLILQSHFATQNRLRAGFEVKAGFRLFGRAPLAWLLAGTLMRRAFHSRGVSCRRKT